jgi:hypothetical protein
VLASNSLHKPGEGKLFSFPSNPVWYVPNIIDHVYNKTDLVNIVKVTCTTFLFCYLLEI